ncbi:oxygen-independent coproporphyrinogen III oxidase [Shewanella xiamenensis]|uniref:Coproporphyrinogen-III oxidase n=2 Tax=Shewanella TaxID=22 RepID=A0AAE4TMI5_9GAMM|nr:MULTISPECIES: oxygen-independent coproporphyrinogen III oxidase [Shewanella]MDI5834076.1 oxygen-independent coproporphyrinogen III oxidase [Shewanella xiamenensis]MDV5392392.1 oxygen-independent coproporphyrinogen III oxidase [Shewanella xiamenensis]QQK62039.1 oxygen-independent coproporphyrinogen III oxidase [Shewanella sp. LC6]QRK79531.1 oxygen-independent coproporphyrinogen III oxidase [Shewanella sp. LZH-2]TPE47072.1 oxygen-independent coproporphyrinogen III oxidase [Shewanella sp. LC2]
MKQPTQISWDQSMIEKYNYSGPRYTSYPTALEFDDSFTEQNLLTAIENSKSDKLSLYIHIPFCAKLCYYCGCNKVITRHAHKADQYIEYLSLEIIKRAPLFKHYTVTQMHWGGGTPTFLNPEQILKLTDLIKANFNFAAEGEFSIEVDPREIELSMLDTLKEAGFNRISIGVQDFNKEVQVAVNREQDEQFIFDLMAKAKAMGFVSTNIDLIYGLPHQTPETFAATMQRVLDLSPDRLSVFNYAHLPARFAAQRKIKDEHLPSPKQKLEMLHQTIETLTGAGYQYIGMDHFAKPDDELAKLQREGKLHRNFQGYTTQEECDLLGLGVSSISQIGDCYAQNQKDIRPYYEAIDKDGHALWKGCSLNRDDEIRRVVIKQLICHFDLDMAKMDDKLGIKFEEYFAEDLKLLQTFIDDKLVEIADRKITISPTGRLLIRNICMCFDLYYRQKARQQQFSRVI